MEDPRPRQRARVRSFLQIVALASGWKNGPAGGRRAQKRHAHPVTCLLTWWPRGGASAAGGGDAVATATLFGRGRSQGGHEQRQPFLRKM